MSKSSSMLWFGLLMHMAKMSSAAPMLPSHCRGKGDDDNHSSTLYTDELNAVPTVFDDALLRALAQPSPEEFTLVPYSSVAIHLPDRIMKVTLSPEGTPAPSLVALAPPQPPGTSSSAPSPPSPMPTASITPATNNSPADDEDRESKVSKTIRLFLRPLRFEVFRRIVRRCTTIKYRWRRKSKICVVWIFCFRDKDTDTLIGNEEDRQDVATMSLHRLSSQSIVFEIRLGHLGIKT